MPSATVTIKVPRKLKEDAKRYGIAFGPVLREALAKQVREAQLKALRTGLEEVGRILRDAGITTEDIVRSVQASREER